MLRMRFQSLLKVAASNKSYQPPHTHTSPHIHVYVCNLRFSFTICFLSSSYKMRENVNLKEHKYHFHSTEISVRANDFDCEFYFHFLLLPHTHTNRPQTHALPYEFLNCVLWIAFAAECDSCTKMVAQKNVVFFVHSLIPSHLFPLSSEFGNFEHIDKNVSRFVPFK